LSALELVGLVTVLVLGFLGTVYIGWRVDQRWLERREEILEECGIDE